MTRVEQGQLAMLAATRGRLDACHAREPPGRPAFQDALTAVARAMVRLEAILHPMTALRHAASGALTEALRDLGYKTTTVCEAIEQGL